MKKLMITLAALALAELVGCTTAHIKTPEWEATIKSHWLKRDVDKLALSRQADGSYSIDLNGYKTDASEQLPAFTREFWGGVAILGRIAGAAVNPAVASVPLTQEAASAADVEKLVKANAELKAQVAAAEALAAKASSATSVSSSGDCEGGECGDNAR
jgi:hypothetical protein